MEWTAARLKRHLLDELLPYWAERGVDGVHGGFHNRLDGAGRPLPDASKRLLVQARQIYAFSAAARLGAPFGLELAARGVAFLEDAFRDRVHGGWFHTASSEGEPLDRRKDCYGHAFVVFALAHYAAASGDETALARAQETAALALARLRDREHGGYHEAADESWAPLRELPRRQNPHMHWFEALLALHAVAPDAALLAEAGGLLALLRGHWLDRERGCLGEHFGADWKPAPGPEGEVVEPGHHYEWCWLLLRDAAARGRAAPPEAETLFAFAERHGIDGSGGVFDRVDRRGRLLAGSQRLWPQTERLKALAARGASAALAAGLTRVFDRYARPEGGWTEQLRADGRPESGIQNATSVYHVVLALREAMEALPA
jgi:mannose/cellobiose epimerase-like protein (N-acyl-D-glucosamine 2-epimerase family)